MAEVEIGGNLYRIGRLSAIRQFHMVRRLAPLIEGLAQVAPGGNVVAGPGADDGEGLDALVRTAAPIIDAIGRMSDENANYLINHALRVVDRRQPGPLWSRLLAPGGSDTAEPQLMFDDVDLHTMMQLVWHVLQQNLTSFFGIAGQITTGARFPAA